MCWFPDPPTSLTLRKAPTRSARSLPIGLVLAAAVFLTSGTSQARQGVVARWTHQAAEPQPWIPESLALAAGGDLLLCSGNYGAPRVLLFEARGDGDRPPRFQDLSVASSAIVLAVAAGRGPEDLFAIAQYPSPDLLQRRTEVAAYDAVRAVTDGGLQPRWTHDMGRTVNAPALLGCSLDGERIFAALYDEEDQVLQLDVLAADGFLLNRATFAAAALGGMAVSGDGRRVLLNAGGQLWVFDDRGGVQHLDAVAPQGRALAISHDGRRVVFSSAAGLEVRLRNSSGTYVAEPTLTGVHGEIAVRAALSRDGGTLASGWWDAQNGVDARFRVHDLAAAQALRYEQPEPGTPGGLQNFPQGLAVSPDGTRVALGSQGSDAVAPRVTLVDVASGQVLFSADLPGSVRALALGARAERVAVGFKNAHANQAAATGSVRLLDTAERSLFLREPVRHDGVLRLGLDLGGAQGAAFLVGVPLERPVPFAGGAGFLQLDRGQRILRLRASTGTGGQAELALPLQLGPEWIGRQLGIQALLADPGGGLRLSELAQPWVF